jgi:hypothetical protein
MLILFYFQLDDLLDDCGGAEGLDWRWCGGISNIGNYADTAIYGKRQGQMDPAFSWIEIGYWLLRC